MTYRSVRSAVITVLSLVCGTLGIARAQLVPVGTEFQVNTYTILAQNYPAIAVDPAGNFIIVWQSFFQDGLLGTVMGQRYASSGAPLGTEFQANTYTSSDQERARVVVTAGGGFVVVWESYEQDGSYGGLFGQRYDSGGDRAGTEFQVSTFTLGYQETAALIADPAGGFAISFDNYEEYSNLNEFYLRRFDSAGAAIGTEFQVNEFTPFSVSGGHAAPVPGGFVVQWGDFTHDGDGNGVFMRRFDNSGVPQGTEFQVNSYTPSSQGVANVGSAPDGRFVVVWSSPQDGNGRGVFGQRYDSAGAATGSEFQVNTYVAGAQDNPATEMSAAGNSIIVWQSANQDGGSGGLFARAFQRDGGADGPELQVNSFTVGSQGTPAIARLGARDFIIAWSSFNQDGSSDAVMARRFVLAGAPITGRKLLLRTPPSGPNRNKLVFMSSDSDFAAPQNAGEDPRCPPGGTGTLAAGGRLRVSGAGGEFTIDLPCLNWSGDSTGKRYHYRDGSGATCSTIRIDEGRLQKVVCKGPQVSYTLGAPESEVSLVLTTGAPATNGKYCATFSQANGATIVRDGSDGKTFKAFLAGLGVCP